MDSFLHLVPFLLQGTPFPATDVTILIIVILVLLTLTAITAGAETAYFSLRAKDINYLKTKEGPGPRQALDLIEQPKLLLATILVSNTALSIAIIIASNMLVMTLVPRGGLSSVVLFGIQVVLVTFLLVMFGAVLPKVYAAQHGLRMALFSAPLLRVLTNIFRPVSRTLVSSTAYFEERLAAKPSALISTEDFEQAIEQTVGHTATREEVAIFKGIVKFSAITARQIMRSRLDVTAVPEDAPFAEVQRISREARHSRLPVYRGNLDTVVGILHTKDLLPHSGMDAYDWHPLIRPSYFVHEGKLIAELRREFQDGRIHMAVVVDEFGGTSGIVTLEDIMEEIIGEIRDEHDEDVLHYKKLDDRSYLFEGKTLINDAARAMGLSPDVFDTVRGESDSVAGLVLELLGKFPTLNETVVHEGYEFTVLELDRMRVKKVKVTAPEGAADEG